jgi:predicted dehydrogenase
VRFAQAGVTAIHASMYRDTLLMLPDDVEIVGFYDPDPETVRKSLKPAVQDVPFYASIPELIEQARPDVVMVSAYCRDMPGWMLQVVQAGVHVWAEKPFAVHSSQLLPVAEAIERNQLLFSCGYSWRFHPISRLIKETYDAGLLGKPYSVDFSLITTSVRRRGLGHWAFNPELSGGGILNWLGCHWFDLMRFLTSSEVVQVAAIEANVSGEPVAIDDGATVSLRFANGMVGSLHCGFFTPGDAEEIIRFWGSGGWAKWNVDEHDCTIKSVSPAWETAPVRNFKLPPPDVGGYGPEGLAQIKALVSAIRGEGSTGYTIGDAIKSLQIIEAAHESARTGRTVSL